MNTIGRLKFVIDLMSIMTIGYFILKLLDTKIVDFLFGPLWTSINVLNKIFKNIIPLFYPA
jgi:hypothetical protein